MEVSLSLPTQTSRVPEKPKIYRVPGRPMVTGDTGELSQQQRRVTGEVAPQQWRTMALRVEGADPTTKDIAATKGEGAKKRNRQGRDKLIKTQ
mmetsp:Transcript_134170/g.267750  ORF Transcript_134170/g.267750 Transcript_134170/m.267750 type:complete len:93 (-) Transcript_134170:190-468(-)